ncbi:hypothetical protein amb2968 [Paramagnetospirillum magneticum AMB-1]|uniref:Uncharacterized protein n=1 Tax=Paramagnetospirillum magneticum (strain ATCC 700264 / AMB-1) TaxID=342108 RepID=Q2W302_PARM1|nr:hypothetical protein amb2968 [Paramagnetospirillum magneticum AMB-1]
MEAAATKASKPATPRDPHVAVLAIPPPLSPAAKMLL